MTPVDLEKQYFHLNDTGEAFPIGDIAAFWDELMTNSVVSEGARRCVAGGWLLSRFECDKDWKMWEMHPEGEELLVLTSGSVTMILEHRGEEQRVLMRVGETLCVPRGVWHTQLVHEPGRMIAVTYGRGTQHRPG